MTRAFLPLMLREGDKQIVNVRSVRVHLIAPGMSSCQTSKLALLRSTTVQNSSCLSMESKGFSHIVFIQEI